MLDGYGRTSEKKKLLILIVFCEGEREREREGLKARTLPPPHGNSSEIIEK